MFLKRRRAKESGSAYIEAVIATPLFLILVVGGIQLMFLAWQALSLQFVATQIVRDFAQRRCSDTSSAPCAGPDRITYAKQKMEEMGARYVVFLDDNNSKLCVTTDAGIGQNCEAPGDPGDIVTVQIEFRAPLLFSNLFEVAGFGTGVVGPVTLRGLASGLVERGVN